MKKPLPLHELLRLLDVCGHSPWAEVLKRALFQGAEEVRRVNQELHGRTPRNTAEEVIFEAFDAYAIHEFGGLKTTSARLHHRGRFYRCYRRILS